MVDVKCSYCGTSFDFNKGLHKEFKDRDFRKYLHFCNQPHYDLYYSLFTAGINPNQSAGLDTKKVAVFRSKQATAPKYPQD